MRLSVTAKNYQMTSSLWEMIGRYAENIQKRFPHINPRLGLLKLTVNRNKRRNYFDSSVYFVLPKKHLYSHFRGITPQETIKHSFDRLLKESAKYKGKHFTNDSQYFRHDSIRKNSEYLN